MQKNEGELCEILIRLLESELGETRRNVTQPELDGSGPPVELRWTLGAKSYAVEHTLLEPFPHAIQTGKEFAELTNEIEAALNGMLPPPGTYRLHFPVHPTAGQHRRTHSALREEIIQWVQTAAQELHDEGPKRLGHDRAPHGYQGTRSTKIKAIPLSLHLRFHPKSSGLHDGALFIYRVVGDNIEELRRQRIATALDKKLGKLAACAAAGDTTVLILEYSDISLTNHVLIAQALETLLAGRDYQPDYVVLADTCLQDSWYFFRPVIDGVFSIDMEHDEVERVLTVI